MIEQLEKEGNQYIQQNNNADWCHAVDEVPMKCKSRPKPMPVELFTNSTSRLLNALDKARSNEAKNRDQLHSSSNPAVPCNIAETLYTHSQNAERHDIVQLTDTLEQIQDEPNSTEATFEEVCASLPPTFLEKMLASAKGGAQQGFLRGLANTLEYALQKNHVPSLKTAVIKSSFYYSSYFMMKVIQKYGATNVTQVAYEAMWETGQLALTHIALRHASQLISKFGTWADRKHWLKTARILESVSQNLGYGVRAYQQGLAKATTSKVAGTLVEKTVQTAGKKTVGCFLDNHVWRLIPKAPKLTPIKKEFPTKPIESEETEVSVFETTAQARI
jgi:hypothetical protein